MAIHSFKKSPIILIFGVVCTTLFLFLHLWSPRFIEENVEGAFLDYRFKVRNLLKKPAVPENIVIVEIDEKSLDRYGRWPWNRALQARLIDKIMKGRPSVLSVDIFYPEHENKKADATLSKTLKKAKGRIVLAAGFDIEKETDQNTPDYLLDNAITDIKDQSRLKKAVIVTKRKTSIPVLSSNAVLGHVFSPSDMDGKLRWECLYVKYGDDLYPSLSLMAAARSLNKDVSALTVYAGRGVMLGDTFIPTDASGRMRINYLGPDRTFQYISAADVLSAQVNPSVFNDKIVFLGTSAISTFDFAVTPFSARMPAVEKNATAAANVLGKGFIIDTPVTIVSLFILVTGLALTIIFIRFRALTALSTAMLLIVLFFAGNTYLFTYQGRYINFVYPFFNMALISVFSGSYKYLTEERRARELKTMFSRYVSPKIVHELIEHPEMAKLGGYRREVTVLFSDVRGFTTFSERRQPEEVVSHLNEYLQEMTDIIFKWEGTLDKFVGDEIMAFWGAPLEQPNHAELAVKCALNMS
ncbi:MAG TPA: adenylate/guanylate cyclase domain-containing protein, partial [Nitrospirota bacterium]|nr:adenylate/guanylate cyclase domain-containing protein [Nitrospirota bacterium]